jgi:uncharacterized protein (TIGR02246 family)
MKTFFFAVLSLFVGASPSFAQHVAGEIEKANTRFEQAFNRGDVAAIAQMYTEQATVLPPGSEMVTGRDAIQKYWQGALQAGLKNLSVKSVRVDEFGGTMAREIGRLSFEVPGQQGRMSTVDGKYVVLWLNTGGDWKIDTDIWNANKLPQPAVATESPAAPATGSGAPR